MDWPWHAPDEQVQSIESSNRAWPKISIVTPSFNQADFLEKTIRSVLLQGYPNLEYIIMDGGSADDSVDIIRHYQDHIDFWVSETDKGQSEAINKGFEQATGDILAWLNSDDFLLPGALESVANAFGEADESVGMVIGRAMVKNEAGEIMLDPPFIEFDYEQLLTWPFPQFCQPACFFTRRAWQQCGPLRLDLDYCMDLDLWLKIARDYRLQRLDCDLAEALAHDAAKTSNFKTNCYARLENSLLLYSYGETETAKTEAYKMVDRLGTPQIQFRALLASPMGRWLRHGFRRLPASVKRLVNPWVGGD